MYTNRAPCKAPGLAETEISIDVILCSSSESQEAAVEKAADEGGTTELSLDEAYQQLERMKERVMQMKSMIVPPVPPSAITDPVLAEFEQLANSDNVQLRELQLETSVNFRQIDQVRSRLEETTKELVDLNARIQERAKCTKNMAKQLDKVPKWIEEFKHQMALCLERHNELDTTCISNLDYSNQMQPLQINLKNNFLAKIPIRCYKKEYMDNASHLQRTRTLLEKTRHDLLKYTKILDHSITEKSTKCLCLLPNILDLVNLLEDNQSLNTKRRSTTTVKAKMRKSFKFTWARTLPNLRPRLDTTRKD